MANDQPVTLSVLAKFHREVILPDIHRVETLQAQIKAIERRLDA